MPGKPAIGVYSALKKWGETTVNLPSATATAVVSVSVSRSGCIEMIVPHIAAVSAIRLHRLWPADFINHKAAISIYASK